MRGERHRNWQEDVLLRREMSADGQGGVGAGDKQGEWGLREGTRAQYRRPP